eukprot:scaffold12197_cov90-Isochrysis_galbana.AAC.4
MRLSARRAARRASSPARSRRWAGDMRSAAAATRGGAAGPTKYSSCRPEVAATAAACIWNW